MCSVCGQDVPITYSLDGGELCHDCLMDVAEDPQLVEDKLPDFIAQHIEEYVDWVCNTTEGDCYGIQDYVERAKPRQFWSGRCEIKILIWILPGIFALAAPESGKTF